MSGDLDGLYALSRFAGERLDLVQAGGGNTSFKAEPDTLFVKASGVALSDVNHSEKICGLRQSKLLTIVAHLTSQVKHVEKGLLLAQAADQVHSAILPQFEQNRPSIETLFHAVVPTRYVLHTHPVSVAGVVCQQGGESLIQSYFPEAIWIPYDTPGPLIAIKLHEKLSVYKGNSPYIIFLQNHGLIVGADSYEVAQAETERIALVLEKVLGIDLSIYRHVTSMGKLLYEVFPTTSLMCRYIANQTIREAVLPGRLQPIVPDNIVYCGPQPAVLTQLDDPMPLETYSKRYQQYPRIICYQDAVYTVAASLRKCQEIEEMLAFHTLVAAAIGTQPLTLLPDAEQSFLMDWDAEKYRQHV